MTGTTVAPATLTTMFLVALAGETGAKVPTLRVKLMVPGMVPVGGDTVNAPGGTPAVETDVVNVPEPETETVPVSPQPTVNVVGVTAMVGATGGGGASPTGPATPTTDGDSITRLSASVTMSELVPQPLWVTR